MVMKTELLTGVLSALLCGCECGGLMAGGVRCLGEGAEASLSPDGSRLVFEARLPNGIQNVGVRDLGSNEVTWLGDGRHHAVHPAWGPDGSIVFACSSITNTAFEGYKRNVAEGWNIYRWQGGVTRKLTSGHFREYTPSVSPDGRFVYFTSTREEPTKDHVLSNRAQMFRVAIDSASAPERVWGPSNLDTSAAVSPQVSPDGRLLAWAQTDDARDTWRIRIARLADPARAVSVTPEDMYAYSPRWSPDGRRIAFAATTFDHPAWGIWIVDPQKDRMIRVVDGVNPSFTADGRGLVYDRDGRIYLKRFDRSDAAVVRPAGIKPPSGQGERTLGSVENPAPRTVIPLTQEAEIGAEDFWIRAKIRTGDTVDGYHFVCNLKYGGSEQSGQLFIRNGHAEFASRSAADYYAPLKSKVKLEPNREYAFVGYRRGERLFLSIDGAAPETAIVDGVYRLGAPQAMVLGRDFNGDSFKGELKKVEFGLGRPSGLPLPPTVAEIFGREVPE